MSTLKASPQVDLSRTDGGMSRQGASPIWATVSGTLRLRVLPALILLGAWELFARWIDALGIPGAFGTLASLFQLLLAGELWTGLWVSNQALVVGYLAALGLGLPGGLFMGRRRGADRALQVWVSLLLATPMAMLIPLVIMALGFGLTARSLVVCIFVLPMIVVNCRAGVRTIAPDLLDMAYSFGASERQLWRHIILPGSSPAIFAGLRIGIGRAVTGMVIVEWLLAAVGLGALLLEYRGSFQPEMLFSIVLVILAESLLLIGLLRLIERRVSSWSDTASI